MCIKLNPKAEEWRPKPHPRPQVAVPVAPATAIATYTSPFPCQGFIPYSATFTHEHHPFYHVSIFQTDQPYSYTVPVYIPATETNSENMERKVKSSLRGKSSETLPTNAMKKGFRRAFPPRLQRAVASFSTLEKKPPGKREWNPARKSAQPDFKVSGDCSGGASQSPTYIGGDFSNSSYTTVMIRNIPNKLRRDFMLNFLDKCCKEHSLEYDFVYLPMDFRRKNNLGYAFVNFTSGVAAIKFKKILENYKWEIVHTDKGPISSKKMCEIAWARIQGKAALVRRFQNSNFTCEDLEFLPVVLDPPRNGSDPNPSSPLTVGTLCPKN